jgi:hypothetical protein
MRIKLLIVSCFLSTILLAVALQGAWGDADAPDGSRYKVSLRKVSHVLEPRKPRSAHEDCDFLRGKGHVQLCAPADEGDAPFSMLCSVFTLMAVALGLALAAGTVNVISPYRWKNFAAQLAGASFIAALLATVVAQAAMPRALAVLDGLPMQLGGLAFSSAWAAIGLLLFAAGLSTTSIMLGHH